MATTWPLKQTPSLTGAGTLLLSVVLLLPSGPLPQAQTLPLLVNARLWSSPAAMATTWPLKPTTSLTGTGTLLPVVLPLPSSPAELSPHAQTFPSEVNARLWLEPAAMATTWPLKPMTSLTGTGTLLSVVLPLPSPPSALYPQAQTLPSPLNAKQ